LSQIKQLASQTVVYGVSSVLGRVLNYLLVPLYTAVFNPGEYGVVTELYAYVAFLNIIYTYGFETAYFRFATKGEDGEKYYNIAQTSLIVTSVLFSTALFVGADWLAQILDYPDHSVYIKWLALLLGIDAIVAVPFARLRLEKKALKFAIYRLINIGFIIGLNLFFLLLCPFLISAGYGEQIGWLYNQNIGVGYVFLSNLIANALFLIFFFNYFRRLKWTIGKEWTVMMIYAAPLMVMGLAGVTNEMLSRAMLKYLLPEGFYPGQSNIEILGIFGACYKISVFMTLAVQSFKYAFEPFFFSKSKEEGSQKMFADVMHGFVILGSFSWLVISVFLEEMAPIFLRDPRYLTGLGIVPWLLGGGLFLGIYYNLSVWYKLTDKTKYGAWITLAGAVATVLLNVVLIPIIGYMGSAITSFATYLMMMVVSYVLGQRHYFVPYYWQKDSFYLILTALLITTLYFCRLEGYFKYLAAIGSILVYCFAVWQLDIKTGVIKLPKRK
jgi:O-antigen/teichoic acid export membrane protein